MATTTGPIFIHSLFRSASHYFFRKFRDIDAFSCYREPFNPSLSALNHPGRHQQLIESASLPGQPDARSDRPDFYEYWEARQHLRGHFHESFAYQQYFLRDGRLPARQRTWLSLIIEHAPARPVLQFCRSAGRIAALRALYGGVHLHLWREPRVLWWAYKVRSDIDSVSQRIYRSAHLPAPLREARRLAGMGRLRSRPLQPHGDYLLFYGLWLDAWLRQRSYSDLSIHIDGIALDPAGNAGCARRLGELAGRPIDLGDLHASSMVFTADEEPFYAQVEQTVNALFARAGHADQAALREAEEAAVAARRLYDGRSHDPSAEQNLRLAVRSLMECLAGGGRPGGGRWPGRWYPKRLHDYVRWAVQRLRPRPRRIGALD
jgi:hypothetical protein